MSDAALAVLEIVSVTVFAFGAVTFLVLAASWWRNAQRRTSPFAWFTIACAGAFLTNLTSALLLAEGPAIVIAQSVCTGLLPPLMLHTVIDVRVRAWRAVVLATYAAALILIVARTLTTSESLDTSASLLLAWTAASALIHAIAHRGSPAHERRWMICIFVTLLCCVLAELKTDHPLLAIAPDYIVLVFFAVRLYYTERLGFFDVFLKGGVYFACGLALATALQPAAWNRRWSAALLLMPAWLIAPFIYRRLGSLIDRRVFRRRYTEHNALAFLSQTLEGAGTEQEIATRAADALSSIFDCPVSVSANGAVHAQVEQSSRPFLSGDHALLQTLSAQIGAALRSLQLRRIQEQQRAREQELQTLATRAELRALRAQINPHFLFNALNTVASCIRTRPDAADETLMQLAEVFRYTLRRSDKEWVRLHEEMDFVRSWLAVEQARFGEHLSIAMNVDEAAASVIIPAMIVQPLVENAIKHGASRITSAARITVDVRLADGAIQVSVTDNGPGFPSGFRIDDIEPGHGLRNVGDRLRQYYGEAGSLRWQNEVEGATVSIRIPTEAAAQCAQ